MLEKKNINDATSSIKGNLYQIYVALQTAFTLKEGESLYIEKYGDISTSEIQTEVKQYENDPLTDLHENFWKTLKNWCLPEFDISNFDYLILLTTQKIWMRSSFLKWNESNTDEKLELLKKIRDKNSTSEVIKGFMKIIFQNEQRLKNILSKFKLVTESPGARSLIKWIKETRLQHIPKNKKDDVLNQLLGYIINPAVLGKDGWIITYDDFSRECINVTEQYSKWSWIFPHHLSENIPNEPLESIFINKLKEIDYFEEVWTQAIKDYFSTRETIANELWNLGTASWSYQAYQDELMTSFDSKYRTKSRVTSSTTLINDSKNLYDDVTGLEPQKFRNYVNTPSYFRNGIMHIIMDEREEKMWKLNLK